MLGREEDDVQHAVLTMRCKPALRGVGAKGVKRRAVILVLVS